MTPTTDSVAKPIIQWLLSEGWHLPEPDDLVAGLCERALAVGLPLFRCRITIRTLHPEIVGVSYTWTRTTGEVERFEAKHELLQSDLYLKSPLAAIHDEGAGGIRRRLDIPDALLDYPILEDLKAEGATDYVAMPYYFTDGSVNTITFAADRPGGFTTAELSAISEVVDVLARLLEVHAMRRTARTLLDTYLGKHSGERVLQGLIKRGDGEDIHAVIWFCDLRGSTPLAESMPRQEFLALLNSYFECMAGAVLDHGGEVLRFIGDAVLAIFPIDAPAVPTPEKCPIHCGACENALTAARDAIARVERLNAEMVERGEQPIGFGIGLHMGDVTYGNIGTPGRLEFSVIGPAANEAARLESMCKELDRPLLISETFARVLPGRWESLGQHSLRGVGQTREIFTVAA